MLFCVHDLDPKQENNTMQRLIGRIDRVGTSSYNKLNSVKGINFFFHHRLLLVSWVVSRSQLAIFLSFPLRLYECSAHIFLGLEITYVGLKKYRIY